VARGYSSDVSVTSSRCFVRMRNRLEQRSRLTGRARAVAEHDEFTNEVVLSRTGRASFAGGTLGFFGKLPG
jgi:hypothetical protein